MGRLATAPQPREPREQEEEQPYQARTGEDYDEEYKARTKMGRLDPWTAVEAEIKDPLWAGGEATTWAKEEAARGANALVTMDEFKERVKLYQQDYGAGNKWEQDTFDAYQKAKLDGEWDPHRSYDEYLINAIWKQLWSEKGLNSQTMIDKSRELGDLQSRDPSKFWEDKPEWQTDAEEEVAKGFESMAGRTEYVGGNRMYATKAISNAAMKIRGKMSDSFIRGREIESRQAELDLKDFLGNAALHGEQALVALDERRQQFKMQQDALRSQESQGNLAFAGTLIASFIAIVAASGSDERLKTVTGTTDKAAYKYLDAMRAAKYHMPVRENAGMSPDEFGIMAQSLEDSELGSQMVQEMLGVKTVEPNHAVRVTMVAQKELHERLKRLERLAGVKELLDV